MAESVRLRQESSLDEQSRYDDTDELEYIGAAASSTSSVTDDVTDVSWCENGDVLERMPKVYVSVSNEEAREYAAPTSADTERLRRERRRALFDVLMQAPFDETDDEEVFFRARDELMRSLDAGALDADETDMLDLWIEALENETRKAVDRQVLQECQVCLEMVRLDKRACCGLAVCEDCMKKYVETQIREAGIVRIGCPNSACCRFMFHEEVRELLRARPDLRDRYDRWLVDINADPRRKTCPRCCRITEMETGQPVDGKRAKYGMQVVCPDCQFTWCFSCQAPWHEGLTCAKNRAGDELLKRWARQITGSRNNAQRCPKCKIYIQRVSGCDHMTCSRCDTKFCYRCGGRRFKIKVFGYRLEDHDKKYSVIGCNDRFYGDNKRLRRILARGSIFGAKVVGGLVALPVICGAAGVALVAVTVAAPFYGAYRLAKRVRRPPPDQFRRYDSDDSDADSHWVTDLVSDAAADLYRDLDLDFDVIYGELPPIEPVRPFRQRLPAAAELRRPPFSIPLTERSSTTVVDIDIEDVESITIEDEDPKETLPPPLPPRRPIYRATVEPRRGSAMNSPLDLCSVELNEDTEIRAVEEPATPPPLPPRQPIRRSWPTASVGRLPPAVQPQSARHVIVNQHDYKSYPCEVASEEITHL